MSDPEEPEQPPAPQHVEGAAAFADAATQLAAQARFQIEILSTELAPELWGTGDFVEALTKIMVERPRARTRILINDPRRVAAAGSRLIDLCRSLPSAMSVRAMSEMHRDVRMEYLLGDDRLALVRDPVDRLDALRYEDDRVEVRRRRERFNVYWDASVDAPGLRRLNL